MKKSNKIKFIHSITLIYSSSLMNKFVHEIICLVRQGGSALHLKFFDALVCIFLVSLLFLVVPLWTSLRFICLSKVYLRFLAFASPFFACILQYLQLFMIISIQSLTLLILLSTKLSLLKFVVLTFVLVFHLLSLIQLVVFIYLQIIVMRLKQLYCMYFLTFLNLSSPISELSFFSDIWKHLLEQSK